MLLGYRKRGSDRVMMTRTEDVSPKKDLKFRRYGVENEIQLGI
jgi:hypothetical protein